MQNIEKVHFSSDHHFGHETAVARPARNSWGTNTRHQFADTKDMERAMVDSWNLQVQEDDQVYVLGDFVYNGKSTDEWVLRQTKRILGKLKGEKHLIVGNHDLPFKDDSMIDAYIESGFKTVIRGQTMLELGGKAFELCHFQRWQGESERLSHYPKPVGDWQETPWLIHGHTHSQVQLDIPRKSIEIGVDAWSFRPVAASTIIDMALSAELHVANQLGKIAPNTYTA